MTKPPFSIKMYREALFEDLIRRHPEIPGDWLRAEAEDHLKAGEGHIVKTN